MVPLLLQARTWARLPEPAVVESLGLNTFTAGEEENRVAALLGSEGTQKDNAPGEDGTEHGKPEKKAKDQEAQPFVFSQGFPPVPAKLVGKILRQVFVDMAELLRDNIEAERRRGVQGEGSNIWYGGYGRVSGLASITI